MSTNSGNRQAQVGNLSPWIILFFNLVILMTVGLLFGSRIPSGCVSSAGVGFSAAIVTLELFHLTWRFLRDSLPADLAIQIGPIKIPIGPLARLLDRLHPWTLSDPVLLIQAFAFFMIAGILWFPASSPFSTDYVPTIQDFLVHHTDGQTHHYPPGDLLQIKKATMVLVEARTSAQPGISCAWSTTEGNLLPAGGCATQYSTSITGNRDTLAVLVKSPCKAYQTFAGLHIEIVEDKP